MAGFLIIGFEKLNFYFLEIFEPSLKLKDNVQLANIVKMLVKELNDCVDNIQAVFFGIFLLSRNKKSILENAYFIFTRINTENKIEGGIALK